MTVSRVSIVSCCASTRDFKTAISRTQYKKAGNNVASVAANTTKIHQGKLMIFVWGLCMFLASRYYRLPKNTILSLLDKSQTSKRFFSRKVNGITWLRCNQWLIVLVMKRSRYHSQMFTALFEWTVSSSKNFRYSPQKVAATGYVTQVMSVTRCVVTCMMKCIGSNKMSADLFHFITKQSPGELYKVLSGRLRPEVYLAPCPSVWNKGTPFVCLKKVLLSHAFINSPYYE